MTFLQINNKWFWNRSRRKVSLERSSLTGRWSVKFPIWASQKAGCFSGVSVLVWLSCVLPVCSIDLLVFRYSLFIYFYWFICCCYFLLLLFFSMTASWTDHVSNIRFFVPLSSHLIFIGIIIVLVAIGIVFIMWKFYTVMKYVHINAVNRSADQETWQQDTNRSGISMTSENTQETTIDTLTKERCVLIRTFNW